MASHIVARGYNAPALTISEAGSGPATSVYTGTNSTGQVVPAGIGIDANYASSLAGGVSQAVQNVISSFVPQAQAVSNAAYTDGSDFGGYIRDLMNWQAENNAQAMRAAEQNQEFQQRSANMAMDWSAQQAQLTRDWQERLSNTAHQREVEDLVKAGLNPILSANAGAAVPTGATGQAYAASGGQAQTDFANASGILSTALNAAIAQQRIDADVLIAQMYTDAQRYGSDTSAGAVKYSADRSNEGTHYMADQSSSATRYASDNSYAGQVYATDHQKTANIFGLASDLFHTVTESDVAEKFVDPATGEIIYKPKV